MAEVWTQPDSPPPPLFVNAPERDFVKQINDEFAERIVGQQITYFPIDLEHTNFDELYGEAIEKNFLPPIRIFASIAWEGYETTSDNFSTERRSSIVVHFYSRRLREDQEVEVRIGDFVSYNKTFYEIVSLDEPRLLFGQEEKPVEIEAKCIKARWGQFNAE